MTNHDVLVLGAGLAGLTAARDLAHGGVDVLVLEARARPGGCVVQRTLTDGRRVQLGGELAGSFHTAYKQLVAELGLTMVPSFVASTGEAKWMMAERELFGDPFPWFSDSQRINFAEVEAEFCKLAATVHPEDPWRHPHAVQLDRTSVSDWLRSVDADPEVMRALTMVARALAEDAPDRLSLLGWLRRASAAGATSFYDYDVWESEKVLEGSATVAERMADQLGPRIQYESPVAAIAVERGYVTVRLLNGEEYRASDVVCALPAGPLRDVRITGLSATRHASLSRIRHARTAKLVAVYGDSFWESAGLDGTIWFETGTLGGAWAQAPGVLSGLVPPGRVDSYLAAPLEQRRQDLLEGIVAAFGAPSGTPNHLFMRNWAVDPWTQGYSAIWRPGDLTAVGPTHGLSEPPFWVCGADHWVAGYMEGAVRTARDTARQLLAGNPDKGRRHMRA